MEDKRRSRLSQIMNTIRNQFIIGLVVAIPLAITVLVLLWILGTIDNLLQPITGLLFERTVPGIGFVMTVLLIYFTGVISSNVVGSRLISFGEKLVIRVPVVRTLYTSVKEVVLRLSKPDGHNFLRVVLVEYPRKGTVSLAFVTGETHDKSGGKLLSLLIPTAPNPLSGYVIVVSQDEVITTNIGIDAAMRMLISCGAILPSEGGNGKPLGNWIASLKEKHASPERKDG